MDESPLPPPGSEHGPDQRQPAPDPLSEQPRTARVDRPALWQNPLLQVYLSAAFVTTSELLLKIGADQIAGHTGPLAWMRSLWIWGGIVAGLVSMVGWLAALRRMPLSVAFVHTNVVHITVPICCWLFLGEELNTYRWVGIAFVLAGITCIAKPLAHIEEAR